MDIAAHISHIALAEAATAAESNTRTLTGALAERDREIEELHARLNEMAADNAALEDGLRAADSERSQLLGEKTVLIDHLKQLSNDVKKLEAFKRSLLQSLQDNEVRAYSV